MKPIDHWQLNTDPITGNSTQTQWHIDHLLGTVTFAAKRMLDVLPDDGRTVEFSTACRHAIATSKAEMVASVVMLERIPGFLGKNEEAATLRLLMELEKLYPKSLSVAAAAAPYHGSENIHEWTQVFQEFQAIESSAIRYLTANQDREMREDLRHT